MPSEGRPLRVAMVCPYSLSQPGGVQGQVIGLATALRSLGHQVTVLGPDDRLPLGPAGGTHVLGRPTRVRANGSTVPVCLSPAAAARAARLVRSGGFDVVHLHEPMAPALAYGLLLAAPVPLVGTFHRAGASPWYRALRPASRRLLARLELRCAVSEAARETAQAAVGGEYEVLFNGVEVDRYTTATPWPSAGPTVLFVGRHEPRKGLEVLLAAFESVPQPARLWVAGSGPESERLRHRYPSSERVQWLGRLTDEEVAARMAAADVLCAPSLRGESFGVVLLEGMAAGAAVVASDLPGYRAAAGGHARLVAPGDRGSLAVALAEALGETASEGSPEREARAAALAHATGWSMARLAERYVDVYLRATERRPSGESAGGRR